MTGFMVIPNNIKIASERTQGKKRREGKREGGKKKV